MKRVQTDRPDVLGDPKRNRTMQQVCSIIDSLQKKGRTWGQWLRFSQLIILFPWWFGRTEHRKMLWAMFERIWRETVGQTGAGRFFARKFGSGTIKGEN